jgi:hypothetical protein
MSWPQNPNEPQHPQQQPQPPQGFGPPPAWTPTGEQPNTAAPAPAGPYGPPNGPQNASPNGTFNAPPPPPGQPNPYGQQGSPGFGPQGQQGQQLPPGHQPPPPNFAPPAPPPGGYSGPPAPPRSRKGLYAAIGAVVALAVIGGAAFVFLGGGKKSDDAKPASTATQAPPPPPTGQGPNSTQGNKTMIPGWQTESDATNGFAYDVPPASAQWKVFPAPDIVSYVDSSGKPIVAMEGTADYREGGCASQANPNAFGSAGKGQLASVGTQGGQVDNVAKEAYLAAGNWGFAAYGGKSNPPKMTVHQATPWNVNGIHGYTATADVTITNRPSACVPPKAVARSIAYQLKDGTIHEWVIYADQGVPNALTPADIDKIMKTVRPYGGN